MKLYTVFSKFRTITLGCRVSYTYCVKKDSNSGSSIELELQVSKPQENSLSSVFKLKHMTPIARLEKANIILEFVSGQGMKKTVVVV